MKAQESIQVRLRRIILVPSAVVVVLATVTFLLYEYLTFRKTLKENVSTVARVVAENSSGTLVFDNPEEAGKVLASLSAEPTIYNAVLFDAEGKVFARYAAKKSQLPEVSQPGPDRVAYEGEGLVAVLPVYQERRVGTLYVEAGLTPLYTRLTVIGTLAGMVLAASFGLAYFLSSWSQKRVTQPLLELSRTASKVSESRDYSLRAPKQTEDEIGGLTEAFNEMLSEIGRRDQALRRSSERLQLALEASLTGTWDWDLQTNQVTWDDQLHALFGLKPGEFSGMPEDFLARIHPEDRPGIERIIRKAHEKRRQFYAEYRILWPDGTVRWMVSRGKALTDDEGKPARTTGVTIDVTESKKAEQALRESEERFRSMADAAPVLIWTADLSEGRDYFNKAWLDFTGRALGQELGFGWIEVVHPEDRENCRREYERAFSERRQFEIEYRLRRHDGEYRVVRDHGIPRLAPGGAFRGYIGSGVDITDIREAQNELERRVQERTSELAETNRELEAFTYSVSHDLRAPLRHINSYAQVLIEDFGGKLDNEAQEYLRRIRAGARNMGLLVDDLLNLARVGRQDLALSPCSLNLLVEEAVQEVKKDAGQREIEWRIHDLGTAECDAGLVKQVFVNLISNAVKYSRTKKQALIEVGTVPAEGKVAYYVRDNGVGFDMKYAGKLFGVFQRLHRPEDFEGTGVGLALVERIVRRHGGRVWAEARPDQGATFYFTLQAKRG